MTAHDDEMVSAVIMAIAKRLNDDPSATKIVLTREQATALAIWFARELFGEPREFIEKMWKSGILPGCSPPDKSWWPK